MNQFVRLIIFALLPCLAVAQSSGLPIDLEADSGYFDQVSGRAVYEGNVKVTQGVATLWAHKIVITMKAGAAEKLEATGSAQKPVKFEYKGEKQPIKGQGSSVVYRVKEKVVRLSGNAKIEQGKDTIKGKQLTYHLDKEVIKGSKVRI